jgi:hypothetical protein
VILDAGNESLHSAFKISPKHHVIFIINSNLCVKITLRNTERGGTLTNWLKITIPIVVVLLVIIAVTGVVLVTRNGSSAQASASGAYNGGNLSIAGGNVPATYGCCRGVLSSSGQGGWFGDNSNNYPPCCRNYLR